VKSRFKLKYCGRIFVRIKAEVCVVKQKVSGVAIQNEVKDINWKK
jgi:hypothetical protein